MSKWMRNLHEVVFRLEHCGDVRDASHWRSTLQLLQHFNYFTAQTTKRVKVNMTHHKLNYMMNRTWWGTLFGWMSPLIRCQDGLTPFKLMVCFDKSRFICTENKVIHRRCNRCSEKTFEQDLTDKTGEEEWQKWRNSPTTGWRQ